MFRCGVVTLCLIILTVTTHETTCAQDATGDRKPSMIELIDIQLDEAIKNINDGSSTAAS